MARNRSKMEIEKMSIIEIERILSQRYNISQAKIEKYPDDIKRDLLFDLETHVGKR